MGDELDKHSYNFHLIDPDLPSAHDEEKLAMEVLRPLYLTFPEMDILDSNHSSLAHRRAKKAGISSNCLKSINEMIHAPKGWKRHDHLIVKCSNGKDVYFAHSIEKNTLLAATRLGMNLAQGHWHTLFNIQYTESATQTIWGAQVGCLIDDNSLASAYNEVFAKRPILGALVIVDGEPILEKLNV